jgi:hypothetical protein
MIKVECNNITFWIFLVEVDMTSWNQFSIHNCTLKQKEGIFFSVSNL